MKILILLLLCFNCMGQFTDTISKVPNDKVLAFIEQNKQECISSWEDGVLPSIKMAQAIIESASGTSKICREANNYFGVKCHVCDSTYNGWRIFKNKEHSFAYINRLYNNMGRYAHLIGEQDIFVWATQLRECGYATSKTYPYSLMYNIMLYDLQKLDSIAFKNKKMAEQDFQLQDVSFRKDTGLNVTYSAVSNEDGTLVKDSITKKSNAKSHPDLDKVKDMLRIHFAAIYGMISQDLAEKDFSEMTQDEKHKCQSVLERITITGVKYIGADSDSRKFILKGKVELLAGGTVGCVTPQVAEDDSRYELSSELAFICDKIKAEVYEYVFHKKYAQLSIGFDLDEAEGTSDSSGLEAV